MTCRHQYLMDTLIKPMTPAEINPVNSLKIQTIWTPYSQLLTPAIITAYINEPT